MIGWLVDASNPRFFSSPALVESLPGKSKFRFPSCRTWSDRQPGTHTFPVLPLIFRTPAEWPCSGTSLVFSPSVASFSAMRSCQTCHLRHHSLPAHRAVLSLGGGPASRNIDVHAQPPLSRSSRQVLGQHGSGSYRLFVRFISLRWFP